MTYRMAAAPGGVLARLHGARRRTRSRPTMSTLGQFGHHPDDLIDAEVEVGRLQGALAEAHAGFAARARLSRCDAGGNSDQARCAGRASSHGVRRSDGRDT